MTDSASNRACASKGQDSVPTPVQGSPAVFAGATIDAALMTSKLRLEQRMFQEAQVTGFAHIDQEVTFYTQIAALLRPDHVVLDFGAGRGEFSADDPARYRAWLQGFRGRCKHVDGCDVDPVVMENPTLDRALTIRPGEPLPYEDGRFDIIVSRYVFEHVSDPAWLARELLRVTKPGGWICAVTPNKWGYLAIAARLVPNRLHVRALRRVQPFRKAEDVFPTVYRLNTPGALRRHFARDADVFYYRDSAVPSYHFGSAFVFRALRVLHRLLPPVLHIGLFMFIRRRPVPDRGG